VSAPTQESRQRSRPSGKVVWVVGLLVTLLVAAVVSYFASAHPDGLEFVAESTGFLDASEDSATSSSPLSDYQTEGVDNSWLSGATAGVVGCLVVLLVMTGIALAVRRRQR